MTGKLELPMQSSIKDFDLTPEEAKTYASILDATTSLPKSDPRYILVLGFTWWLVHRKRRIKQQIIRRRQFSRRIRRLMYIRWHHQRNLQQSQEATIIIENILHQNKQQWNSSSNNREEDFWHQLDSGTMDPSTFFHSFHMSQNTFNLIYNELEYHLTKCNTTMREPLPAKKRLAATLYRLATNAEYQKVSSLFGIGKSTTTSLVRDVCEVIVTILRDKYLSLNQQPDNLISVAPAGVAGVLGSIDVFIVGSTWDWNQRSPFSSIYSQSYALVFQGLVDFQGCFRHACANCPAGMSNKEVLQRSNLLSQFDVEPGERKLLFADNSYSGMGSVGGIEVITPAETESDEKMALESSLQIFQQAVQKVKSRWKIFHGKNGKINFHADAFENIALACCILHNVCERNGDPVDSSWTLDVGDGLCLRRGNAPFAPNSSDKQAFAKSSRTGEEDNSGESNNIIKAEAPTNISSSENNGLCSSSSNN